MRSHMKSRRESHMESRAKGPATMAIVGNRQKKSQPDVRLACQVSFSAQACSARTRSNSACHSARLRAGALASMACAM